MSTTTIGTPAPEAPSASASAVPTTSPAPTSRPSLVTRPSSMATMSKTIVLVTGGNTGIGFQIVKALSAQPGMQVLLGCRDTRKGEAAAASLGAPRNVNPIQIDITDDESIEHCYRTVEQLFGRLDVLINNAGTAGLDMDRAGLKPSNRERWNHVMNINVNSTAVFTDVMIPLLEKSKQPKIIFISSRLGSVGHLLGGGNHFPALSYHASKSAINMMTAWYSRAQPKFKVNAVCPGFRATGLNDAPLNDQTDPALGAIDVVNFANAGPDGTTGTFIREGEPLPW